MALGDFISKVFGSRSANGTPSALPKPDNLSLRGPSGRIVDPAWDDGDDREAAIPQVLTYAAVIGTAYRTYVQDRWDEAIKHDREDAQVMWRDCWLHALLNERIKEVTRRKWHLKIEDEDDPVQVGVRDLLQKSIERIPYFRKYLRSLLLDRWYGRYAVQNVYHWQEMDGERVLSVKRWIPVNGDKLAFQFDGTPAVAVHGGITDDPQRRDNAEYVITTIGRALLLKGTWRHRFVISKHEIDDGDYFDPESAPTVHGVGIRHRIFWLDWLRREFLGWVVNYMERVGQGLTIWFYDDSNPQARAEAEQAAKLQSNRMNIVWPRGRMSNSGSGVERIEVPVQGSQFLFLLQANIEEKIERYVVGQKLSADHRGSGGLGGSGAADFQRDTKKAIGDDDAINVAESLTGSQDEPSLVWTLKQASFPWADFPVSFEFEKDPVNPAEQLEAVTAAYALGVDFVKDEVRALTGLSKPVEGDETISQMQQAYEGAMMGAMFGEEEEGEETEGGAGDGGNAE
jgi:hypothetical protein